MRAQVGCGREGAPRAEPASPALDLTSPNAPWNQPVKNDTASPEARQHDSAIATPQPGRKELAMAIYQAACALARLHPSRRHDDFRDHALEVMTDAAAAEPGA